ncbi:MAG: hypothetical protein JNL49_02820 [Bacteroidia bacterium]|nr:hypothetical protein [Bacteroidia bacterium]
MKQDLEFPQQMTNKEGQNIEINKEEAVEFYKKFYRDNLLNVANRNKALNDLEQLIRKHSVNVDSNFLITQYSFESEAEDVLKKHFSSEILQGFNKTFKPDLDLAIGDSKNLLQLYLHAMAYETDLKKRQNSYRIEYLRFVYDCLNDYGLHKYILERDIAFKRYNVVVHYFDTNKLRDCDEKMLINYDMLKENYLTPYKQQLPIKINGKLIFFKDIISIQITSTLLMDDEIYLLGLREGWKWTEKSKNKYGLILASCDETDELTTNPFLPESLPHARISQQCINELKKLQSQEYNFNKLILLLEELNMNMSKGNFYSVSMLTRAIIDHIPPLFNAKNFSEFVANLKGTSFKSIMTKLDQTSRKIADISLHQSIEKKEILLTETQVNVFAELETLINKIISEYK